jgi:phage terminase large subunit
MAATDFGDVEINVDIESVVLPVYHHLFDPNDSDYVIEFLYGGRDSAKSYTTAQMLVIECISLDYFRCALIREQSGDVKDSQWQLLKDIIEEWGLSHLFSFTKAPLEINCLMNNNKFIARGCNEIQNLKSITACNRAWIEEGVKSRESMTVILGTIRSSKSKVKIYYTFNPEFEGNYHTWWLFEDWFAGVWNNDNLSFKNVRTTEIVVNGVKERIDLKYRVTHTTYKDNPYVSPERIALHESNKGYYYTVYTKGLFGYLITGGEFWTGFKSEKHTEDFEKEEGGFHVVIDSNTAPYVTVAIWQINEENKVISQYRELPCRSPHASAPRAARKLNVFLCKEGYEGVVFLYGDSTANNKTTVDEDNASFFTKFKEELASFGWIIEDRIGKTNPRVALSGDFINDLYEDSEKEGEWKIRIHKSCTESIEDYTMSKKNKDGGILKKMITNKETGVSYQERGHFSDTKRYFLCNILSEEFENYGNRNKKGFLAVSRGNNKRYIRRR